MRDYYLSIGSNIHPAEHIPACMNRLREIFPSIRFSTVYETDPVGPAGSEKFWNLAAAFVTQKDESTIRNVLREIETALGRIRSPENRFLPRTIDIDVLPQPGYQQHAFIMIPLAEIAANAIDPETGKTFKELSEEIRKDSYGFEKQRIFLKE